MYRRLLVTLDGSRVGEAALKHVEELIPQLSRAVTYEVILLQVRAGEGSDEFDTIRSFFQPGSSSY